MTTNAAVCRWALAAAGLWLASCAPHSNEAPQEQEPTVPDTAQEDMEPSAADCTAYALATDSGAYEAGARITLAWAAPASRPEGDWVGVFRAGEPDAPSLLRQNIPVGAAGLLSFIAPARGGRYELRYLTPASSLPVATSAPFTVTAVPGNILLLSNYEGGTYTLVMDQNLPNIQIGIVSYEPTHVTLTGPYVGNVSAVRLLSYKSTASSVQGVPAGKVQILPPQPVTHRQPYANRTLSAATGQRVLTWPGGGGNTTTQVEEYFLSEFGEVPLLSHRSQYAAFSGSLPFSQARLNLVVVRQVTHLDVASAVGNPSQSVSVLVEVNATVGALSPSAPALTTGNLPTGSSVRINNYSNILGAGGAGGSGGNGGGGGRPRSCNRAGLPGGPALRVTAPLHLDNRGNVWGGGGGGGGGSGCNEAAGGGGGAGFIGGAGGPGATLLSEAEELAYCGQDNGYRTGTPGIAGGAGGGRGGRAGDWSGDGSFSMLGGDGGGYGQRGEAAGACSPGEGGEGGAPGAAIQRNGYAVNVPDGLYDTGGGRIRGPVSP